MYKTVRHGENSLQYTILPQQDDVSSAMTANNSNRTSAGVRRRARRGRTATILIMTLILACGVVGAAVVVPLLISTDLVSLPTAFQRFSSSKNFHHHGGHHNHHAGILQRNRTLLAVLATAQPNATSVDITTPEDNTIITLTTTPDDKPDTSSKTGDTTTVKLPSRVTEGVTKVPFQVTLSLTTQESETRAGTLTTQLQEAGETGGLLDEDGGAKEHDHVGGSKKKALQEDLSAALKNGTTRIIVFSSLTSKENKSVSSLDETTATSEAEQDVVMVPTERPKLRSWLEPRWPFADPSSYFQWTGYNGRDSLLLPVILGGALMVLLLAICICYSLRRRRQKTLRRQTIGKISSDLQCGDKTTLLPDGSEEE